MKTVLRNYADDNTPYTTDKNVDIIINTLLSDIDNLKTWFNQNYFLLNNDKCNLLITNHDEDVSLKIGQDIIKGKKCVKLLGVKIDNKLDIY